MWGTSACLVVGDPFGLATPTLYTISMISKCLIPFYIIGLHVMDLSLAVCFGSTM